MISVKLNNYSYSLDINLICISQKTKNSGERDYSE